jgi:hypothetical protein
MAQAVEAPAQSSIAEGLTSHTPNPDLEALVARLERLEEQKANASGTYGYTRAEQMEALHRLREPFPTSEVRYRPQPWCKKCSQTQGWPKVCQNHNEIRCQRCNNQKITEAHICLKYIGHAEATNRLLNVDPFWDWLPLALDGSGLPQYDGNRGLWIRMTVCGMTRIGYGDATGKDGANAVKEIIGDAIRNAGMRFGMALDLWTSSDLEILESGGGEAAEQGGQSAPARTEPEQAREHAHQAPPTSAPDEDPLARLIAQYRNCWDNPTALLQIRLDGKKNAVSERSVQGPPPESNWTTFDALLEARITELQPTKTPEGSAA